MFTTSCPSCGAPVQFKSTASVMAVCGYCRATLLREADAVRDLGRMADLLEDYSPVQITTSGVYQGRPFGVVGRIQLRYDDGAWNEWYLVFEDGGSGWLGDFSGQYTLTLDKGRLEGAPAFTTLTAGQPLQAAGATYTAADVRTARCVAGEGELPFQVGAGWEAPVADFRRGGEFLTLDYSDGDPPRLYLGRAVTLVDLKCQLLRSDDDILRRAGRLLGQTAHLACPGCGASLGYPAGVATQLVCPACGTRTDVTGDQATVLEAGRRLEAQPTTLELGDVAQIDGVPHTLIGLLRCQEVGESETWVEYLLHAPGRGFVWLVETDAGWERAQVQDVWPETSGDAVRLGSTRYRKLYDYPSRVLFAAGAFNWRVKAGDTVDISDWQSGQTKLTRERSPAEITWSRSTPVTAATLSQWFGKPVAAPVAALTGSGGDSNGLAGVAWRYTLIFLILNVPIALFGDGGNWVIILLALALFWWPVLSPAQSGDD